jgi:polyhydroxyalkanoate synthesis repressor PhaR
MTQTEDSGNIRLIKKYPNRRLYDTRTSAYITLSDVKQLVLDGERFQVVDAKSGEDLTRSILLQIILEEESGGKPMFSATALSQIIRFYGHAMQGVMGAYLEKNIQAFIEIQERMAEQSQGMYGTQFGPEAWTQFMNVQAPILQNMMSNYVDQSKNLFVQMQDQMQDQTRSMFSVFPLPSHPRTIKNRPRPRHSAPGFMYRPTARAGS